MIQIMIDTSLANNIRYVRPYLGILLIGSMALGFGLMINNAAQQLTQTIHTTVPVGVEGGLAISKSGKIYYGDTISYVSSVSGLSLNPSNTYITTVCFQGDVMVFQKSAQQGVSVHLYDQTGGGFDWDGKNASCSATLMYRTVGSESIDIFVVDSISFDVLARGY